MAIPLTIADDSLLSRKNIRKALPAELDVNIVEACNGAEALKAVAAGQADVLLLDLQMPVLDGFEVLAELKAQEANTVVIVISADIQPQAVARVLSLGASGFLKKPLQEAELRQMFIKVGLL